MTTDNEFADWTTDGLRREGAEINTAIVGLLRLHIPGGRAGIDALEARATAIKQELGSRARKER